MTKVDAAQRLGVHETAVVSVVDHSAGCVVTLRDGRVMLVSETTARAYVPEVDDPAPKASRVVGEDGPELMDLPEGATVKKAAASKKGARGAASS
ncbi:hypothetical protein [Catelliglobosispora koreensis]|uniref:hypothetical protein n=1 Tax=Catelliglobosispora koreensis TaxID=129052 RepID=UPI000363FD60|nr:hypothetical protein [Catelliglobosispora koreensis]